MRNEDSSQEHGNEEWSGTNSYEEAQSLLIHGYEDPVKSIKSSLAKNKKLTSKIYSNETSRFFTRFRQKHHV